MKRTLSLATMTLLFSVAVPQLPAADKSDSSIYELRRYTTAEGKLPALHKRFREHTLKLFKKHGMTNVIYWTPENQKNTLIYLLKHDSVDAAKKSFAAFRTDSAWQKAFKESRKNGPLVTKVESTYLKPTDYSPKSFAAAKPGWVYELRVYTTNKGKLPNLNARFRDHTLVYFIAHKDRKAADASWKAFGSDRAWQTARKESEKSGAILAKGGVRRVYLKTTDYSPVK